MDKTCCITGCQSTDNFTNRQFYEFPSDVNLCRRWVESCGDSQLLEDLNYGGVESLSTKTVCSCHFNSSDFIDPELKRLKPNALPKFSLSHIIKSESDDYTQVAYAWIKKEEQDYTVNANSSSGNCNTLIQNEILDEDDSCTKLNGNCNTVIKNEVLDEDDSCTKLNGTSIETPLFIPNDYQSEEDTLKNSCKRSKKEQLPLANLEGNRVEKRRKTTYKRKDLSISDKLQLLREYDKLKVGFVSQREASAKLGVTQGTLSKWLKNRDALSDSLSNGFCSRKRKRNGKNRDVEGALLVWAKQAILKNASLTRSVLFKKANDFAAEMGCEFKATDGWLTRWKIRHDFLYKKRNGTGRKIFDTDRAERYQLSQKGNTTEQDDDEQTTNFDVELIKKFETTSASLSDDDNILNGYEENENEIQPEDVPNSGL